VAGSNPARAIWIATGLYTMEFTLRYCDRYNWDAGKTVHIGQIEIADVDMGIS
jgi:hypothetical protein